MAEKNFTQIQSVHYYLPIPRFFHLTRMTAMTFSLLFLHLPFLAPVYSRQRNERDLVKTEGHSCYHLFKTQQAPHIQLPTSKFLCRLDSRDLSDSPSQPWGPPHALSQPHCLLAFSQTLQRHSRHAPDLVSFCPEDILPPR